MNNEGNPKSQNPKLPISNLQSLISNHLTTQLPNHLTTMNPSPESFAAYFAQVQATPGWDAILQSFARFANIPPNSRVLDVGCGPGALARHLVREGHTVTGIDADPLMIERAQYLSVESKAQF